MHGKLNLDHVIPAVAAAEVMFIWLKGESFSHKFFKSQILFAFGVDLSHDMQL